MAQLFLGRQQEEGSEYPGLAYFSRLTTKRNHGGCGGGGGDRPGLQDPAKEMSSSSKGKEKGKGKGKDPSPPLNKFVDVFMLDIKLLGIRLPAPGTFRSLLSGIRNGAIKRTKSEWKKAKKSEAMAPQDLHSKPVLPSTDEVFVVAVTNRQEETVLYLFNWKNLYNTGFYVNECWYLFQDANRCTLPPAKQFRYVPVVGKGIYELKMSSSYANVGKKQIMLGPEALDSYVHKYFTFRARLHRASEKPKMTDELKVEMQNGPFSFGPVVISEPSRFLDYQVRMLDNIFLDVAVPKRFTQFFTSWSKLCVALRYNRAWVLKLRDEDDVPLTMDEVRAKIALLLFGGYLFPE